MLSIQCLEAEANHDAPKIEREMLEIGFTSKIEVLILMNNQKKNSKDATMPGSIDENPNKGECFGLIIVASNHHWK